MSSDTALPAGTSLLRLPYGPAGSPGRNLAYCAMGPADGLPVIFVHGWGDSRLVYHPDLTILTRLGLRLVTVDRPGVGFSDFQPARRLQDFPADMVQLADHLGFSKFILLGHSGGGPHVLACARWIPQRLAAVGLVSGLAPFDRPSAADGLPLWMRLGVPIFRRAPGLARALFAVVPSRWISDPIGVFEKYWGRWIPARDRAVLRQPGVRDMFLVGAREAFRQGTRGLAQDLPLFLGLPWGFQPREVSIPVRMWYGTHDSTVPLQMGRYLHSQIRASQLEVEPGGGHLLFIEIWETILTALRGAADFGNPE